MVSSAGRKKAEEDKAEQPFGNITEPYVQWNTVAEDLARQSQMPGLISGNTFVLGRNTVGLHINVDNSARTVSTRCLMSQRKEYQKWFYVVPVFYEMPKLW